MSLKKVAKGVGSIFGGPKKQRPSAQDLALVEQAMRDQEFFERVFLPEEIKQIRESDDPRTIALESMMLRGRANADVMQAGQQNIDAAVGLAGTSGFSDGRGVMGIGRAIDAVSLAENAGQTDADLIAQNRADIRRLNTASTGQGLRSQGLSRLADSARRANSRAAAKLEANAMVTGAIHEGIGSIGGAAFSRGRTALQDRMAQRRLNTLASTPQTGAPVATPNIRDGFGDTVA